MKKFDLPSDHQIPKVGYRSPPKAHQFRKGRSGNPRGRKAGEENMIAIFKRQANRRVKVNDNGRLKSVSFAEAVILQNYKAALQGKPNARANMLRLAEEADEFKDWSDPKVAGGLIFMPTPMSEEEFGAENDAGVVRILPNRSSGSQED